MFSLYGSVDRMLMEMLLDHYAMGKYRHEREVARLDRKRLGAQCWPKQYMPGRGGFDKQTRRKALAFAADAVCYGI
jgi:hypothetical protein